VDRSTEVIADQKQRAEYKKNFKGVQSKGTKLQSSEKGEKHIETRTGESDKSN